MKALLITYHFPPMLGCCSLRTGAIARLFASKGWECHILTAAIPSDHAVYTVDAMTLVTEPLWHVYPISEGRLGNIVQRFRQRTSRPRTSESMPVAFETVPQPSWGANLLRALAFPDSKLSWIPRAHHRATRLIKRHRFDLVYSFGYPWSCHVVACAVQRKTGTPWIADYADPWTLNPDTHAFPSWRNRLDFWFESRLLRRTTAVIVATPEAKAFTRKLFGSSVANRTRVARVAQFPPEEYGSPANRQSEQFQIAFTGLFNSTRQPYSFYEAARVLRDKSDVRICLAGLIDDNYRAYANRLGLEGMIHHVGRLGRRQTIELQQTSQILLSFGWPGGLQVPCKLYEYFAARRPILHIAGDARDPAATLVRNYHRGLVVPNNLEAIRDGLCTLYGLWTAGRLEQEFDLSQLDEFCLPQSLKELEDAINNILPRERQTVDVPVSDPISIQL